MSSLRDPRRFSRRDWIVLTSGLTLKAAPGEELRRLAPPSDQAPDPTLAGFVTQLKKVVGARDHAGLTFGMGATFRVEFDSGQGPVAFRRYWKPESPSSPVWGILEHLLEIAGYSYSSTLHARPYAFARFPFDLDRLNYVVAVKETVPLLAEPASNSKQLASTGYSILPLARPALPPVIIAPGTWVEVQHPAVGRCFAASRDIYQPAAHRMFFEKRAGRWRWISLAAATLADPPELKRKLAATA